MLFFPANEAVRRVLFGMVITVVYMATLLVFKPYKRGVLNYLSATVAQFALLFSMIVALCMRIFIDVADRFNEKSAQAVMDFEGPSQMVSISIVITFLVIIIFSLVTVYQGASKSLVPLLRLISSNQVPELSLDKYCHYVSHVFLSHTWSTGQDQVATIKRTLQLLLPGVQVFLDVDNLDDMEKLEDYVQQSQCLLMFLSKGYFESKYCLREVDYSFRVGKPTIFVHEADVKHGGASLAALREECKSNRPELAPKVFDDTTFLSWYRAGVFQQLTLKLISQALLHATPEYSHFQQEPALYAKGEILQQSIAFEPTITVYASSHNEGAMDLANELLNQFGEKGLQVTTIPPAILQDATSTRSNSRKLSFAKIRRNSERARRNSERSPSISSERSRRNSELALSITRKLSITSLLPSQAASQMLLYLDHNTFVGEAGIALAMEVRQALLVGLPILLAHENDQQNGRVGCEFSRFFLTTPEDLVSSGVYRKIATPCYPEPYRAASIALLAIAAGGKRERQKRLPHLEKALPGGKAVTAARPHKQVMPHWAASKARTAVDETQKEDKFAEKKRASATKKIRWSDLAMRLSAVRTSARASARVSYHRDVEAPITHDAPRLSQNGPGGDGAGTLAANDTAGGSHDAAREGARKSEVAAFRSEVTNDATSGCSTRR